MTATDIVNKLIMDAIAGYQMAGSLKDGFVLDRDNLQLRRISDPAADEIMALAKSRNIEIEFDSVKKRFNGTIDLEIVSLNERQTAHLDRVKKRRKDS